MIRGKIHHLWILNANIKSLGLSYQVLGDSLGKTEPLYGIKIWAQNIDQKATSASTEHKLGNLGHLFCQRQNIKLFVCKH